MTSGFTTAGLPPPTEIQAGRLGTVKECHKETWGGHAVSLFRETEKEGDLRCLRLTRSPLARQHAVHQTAERHAQFDGTLRCRYVHRASRVIGKSYPLRVSAAR